jgi:hypothetical protein
MRAGVIIVAENRPEALARLPPDRLMSAAGPPAQTVRHIIEATRLAKDGRPDHRIPAPLS